MNDNTNLDYVKQNLADSLATETGIDTGSAFKVVNWLITEGVIDMPVLAEQTVGA